MGARAAARAREPPARSRRLALPRAEPVEPPFLCLLASGGHTLLLDVRDHAGYERARLDARRRGRRGVRQGRPPARPAAIRAAPRSTGSRGRAIRTRSRSRSRACPGFDFSFSGLKTALLYAVRDLDEGELERRRADLAASYQRAIVRALVRRTREAAERTGAERVAVVGGVAANSELRASLARRRARAARALHRQRGDDRLGREVRARRPVSRLPWPRCACLS